jgi:hypothetical protein
MEGGAKSADEGGAITRIGDLIQAIHEEQYPACEQLAVHVGAEDTSMLADEFPLREGFEQFGKRASSQTAQFTAPEEKRQPIARGEFVGDLLAPCRIGVSDREPPDEG